MNFAKIIKVQINFFVQKEKWDGSEETRNPRLNRLLRQLKLMRAKRKCRLQKIQPMISVKTGRS